LSANKKKNTMIEKQFEKEVPLASLFFGRKTSKMTKKCYPQKHIPKR